MVGFKIFYYCIWIIEIFLYNIKTFKIVNIYRFNEVYFVDNGKLV